MKDYWFNQHINRGFHPGSMVVTDKFFYVPIPKNSSSYITALLRANDWQLYNFLYDNTIDKKCIILLRDPVDRWITGISQYLCSYVLDHDFNSRDLINDWSRLVETILFDRVIFDDHTEKQCYFFNSIPIDQCVFFDSTNKPEVAIKKYLNSHGYDLNINLSLTRNASTGNREHHNLCAFITNVLQENPAFVHRLKDVYRDDYNLIETVNFYA